MAFIGNFFGIYIYIYINYELRVHIYTHIHIHKGNKEGEVMKSQYSHIVLINQ